MASALARMAAGVGLAALLLAGCGDGSGSAVRTPGSAPPTTRTPPPSGSSSGSSSGRGAHPVAVVTPATGLHDRQVVAVRATGFSPGEALQVIQCAAKQQATGPGDCNLTGMVPAVAGADGTLVAQLVVLRGPFGGNQIVCGPRQPCLVAVTQASLTPSEEADAPITFATG